MRLWCIEHRHGYDSFFHSIQLSLRKFRYDSTHDSQWPTRIDLKQLTTQNGSLKFDSYWLPTQKLPEFWFKSTHGSKKLFRILIRTNSWLNDAIHSQFRMTFLGIQLHRWIGITFFGLSTQVPSRQIDLSQLMTQAVSRRLESIQLMTQTAFQELTHNQLMTQMDSQVLIQIDSWLKTLPDLSIQINSWLKRKTFDSESTHDSTLSYTHVWYNILRVHPNVRMKHSQINPRLSLLYWTVAMPYSRLTMRVKVLCHQSPRTTKLEPTKPDSCTSMSVKKTSE